MNAAQEITGFDASLRGYFRAPDPMSAVESFARRPISGPQSGGWDTTTVLVMPVFWTMVFDRSPDAAHVLVDAVRGGNTLKIEVVAQALNYSRHPDRQRLMERLVGEHAAGTMEADGVDWAEFVPSHPVHVDMFWAAFHATGDAVWIERLARLLSGWRPHGALAGLLVRAKAEPAIQAETLAAVLAMHAFVSLSREIRDMPEVRAPLADFANRLDGAASAVAARIIAGGRA